MFVRAPGTVMGQAPVNGAATRLGAVTPRDRAVRLGARARRPVVLAVLVLLALAVPGAAADERAADQALAERYAPVLLLRTQSEPCDRQGDAYFPVAVETFLGRGDVTLVGPGGTRITAPKTADLAGRGDDWYLDFPGNPLRPGCDFERWFQSFARGKPATVYAHVVAEDGRLALQYWLYYVFNDWNNTHEGDWEMLQIMFDAPTATAALRIAPTEVGFSQHTGGERSDFTGGSLQRDGDHALVFPAAGSHAQFFSSRLWLGFSAETGIGCDDTRPPSTRLVPRVTLLPDTAPTSGPFAWLSFAGLWGERVRGPYSGPTGPAEKRQWDEPVGWSEGWRDGSLAVPDGRSLGPTATGVFCGGVAAGSVAVLRLLYDPLTTLIVLAVAVLLGVVLVRRTRWSPVAVRPVDRARPVGLMLRDGWRIWNEHRRLLLTIGAVSVPLGLLGTLWVEALLRALGLGDVLRADQGRALFGGIAFLILSGGFAAVLPLVLVTMAVAAALGDLAEDRPPRLDVRRLAGVLAPVVVAVGLSLLVQVLLVATVVGAVLALVVLVATSLAIQACVLERRGGRAALRRSVGLVRRNVVRVVVVTITANGLALLAGPLVGLALLFLESATLPLIDVVSSIVYVAVLPYAAVVQTLLFFDARGREHARLEVEPAPAGAAPAGA
jgi:hypothetical protein